MIRELDQMSLVLTMSSDLFLNRFRVAMLTYVRPFDVQLGSMDGMLTQKTLPY